MHLPLCHVASGDTRRFDCTWRTRTKAERFVLCLHKQVHSHTIQRSTMLW